MRHPKTGPKVTAIIEALLRTGGMMSKTARILRCDVKTLWNRRKEHPEIQEALEQAEAIRLDNAETRLDQNIENGNQKAIEFFLKNKGASRGYGQNKEGDEEVDLGTVIEMFQKGLEEAKVEFPMQPVIEVNPIE